MNLREKILNEHSRKQCDDIVSWVGNDQQRFDELFSLFLSDEYRVVQRSAWPVSYCVEAFPAFITKHYPALIKKLEKPSLPDAVKRNSTRLLQHVDIPKRYCGSIMDICFRFVASPDEAVAIKAFALTVLGQLAKKYPDIIPEIILTIEDQYDHQRPSFQGRAKKLLKEFKKL